MSGTEALKRRAAERAVGLVEDGMAVGLGTGSTARHVLDVLAERRAAGELRGIVGVPTSRDTADRATALGIPLATLDERPSLDLTIDGADEVDPELRLIKGLGGALLWEKIVASASARMVVVVDGGKLVRRLGERAPVPVEVVPFGARTHFAAIEALGAEPTLRTGGDGGPFVTDGGHHIVDCRFDAGIDDPDRVEAILRARPGVVETGLFLRLASEAVVATERGVELRRRGGADAELPGDVAPGEDP